MGAIGTGAIPQIGIKKYRVHCKYHNNASLSYGIYASAKRDAESIARIQFDEDLSRDRVLDAATAVEAVCADTCVGLGRAEGLCRSDKKGSFLNLENRKFLILFPIYKSPNISYDKLSQIALYSRYLQRCHTNALCQIGFADEVEAVGHPLRRSHVVRVRPSELLAFPRNLFKCAPKGADRTLRFLPLLNVT